MSRTRAAVALALGAAVLAPRTVAAADHEACARAYESAQAKRLDGKLVEARHELVACAQDACPAVLRKDCAQWLSEVDAQMPTIAVRAIGVDGCDHPEAEVLVDGVVIANAAEGRAFSLDPGPHVVRATIGKGADATSTEQRTVVAANERQRTVTVAFGTATTCTHDKDKDKAPRTSERRPIPTSVFVLGGIGVVAAGVAAAFSVNGWNQKSALDECKGTCAQRDVDTMRRTFIVADLSSVAAIGTWIAASVLYLTR